MYKDIKLKNVEENSTKLSIYHNVTRILAMKYSKGFGVKRVTIYKNQTPYTMEYIINRIEQIPFKGEGVFRGSAKGDLILSDLFKGSTVYTDIMILKHEVNMELDVEVEVIENKGFIHSKYSPIQSIWYNRDMELCIRTFDYKTIEQLKEDIKNGLNT
jgi:hypothetical protein